MALKSIFKERIISLMVLLHPNGSIYAKSKQRNVFFWFLINYIYLSRKGGWYIHIHRVLENLKT